MRRLRGWLVRLGGSVAGNGVERELADEIESHLQMHTDENIRRGLSPEAARRAALLKLGGIQSVRETCHDQRGIPLLEHLGQDLRYAARTMRRSKGVTAVAVLTIALGIAGPTMTFTMMKAWILDPLPFSRPDDLVDLRNLDKVSGDVSSINPADFLDWQRAAASFESMAGYRPDSVRLTGGDRAEQVRGAQATPNFFHLLGVDAAAGRVFDARDGQAGPQRLAVVSHRMWREHLGADPGAVGRSIRLDSHDYTIVGVLPETFQFTLLGNVDVWRLLAFRPEDATNRGPQSMVGLGLLRQGHTLEQARGELTAIAGRLSATYPETNARRSIRVLSLADEIRTHHDAGFIIPILFAMVMCVLLVACVNVTNVMLARASARRQEMAIRLALGASRARIIRQWLVEHVLLFVGASAIGAALAVYGTQWITHAIPEENRQFLRNYGVLSVDRAVVLFALGIGAVCGALFGWLPAWAGAQADVNVDLRDGSARATTGKSGARLRASLVVCEVALALALLISAGLLVATSRNISRVDVGFEPRNLLTFQLSLDPLQYRTPAAVANFYKGLTADLAGRPGVVSAAAGSLVPFGTQANGAELFFEGRPDPTPSETPVTALNQITADYAATLRLRLRRGRLLNGADSAEAPKVAMINETLASHHFVNRDPLGQRVRLDRGSPDVWTVVGVVADVKNHQTIEEGAPEVYVPLAQQPRRQMTVAVRSNSDPQALIGTMRGVVAAFDPAEPVADVATMESRISRETAPFAVISMFVTVFGAVALLLAGVGVYGVIAYSFAQRTREIGIRMALGARHADVAALVLRQIRTFLLAGLVPGLALAWALGHAMKAILFGVTPTDWRLYTVMSLVLTIVALLAALVPARRATAIDPMTALRYE